MGTGDFLWKFLKRSFVAGLIGVPFLNHCYGIGITEGLPMPPTPNSNVSDSEMMAVDVILVDKFCLRKYDWSHGDITICRHPIHKEKVVQRIIGLPGDWILTSRYKRVVKVPEGYCWTEGDNSKLSLDLGMVPLDMITYRVSHILWPPQRMGKICKVDKRIPQKKFLLYYNCIQVDERIPQKKFLLYCNGTPSPYSFE